MDLSKVMLRIKRAPVMVGLGCFILLVLIYAAYQFYKTPDAEKKDFRNVAVEVEVARVGSLTRTITAVGTLRANQSIVLRSEIAGIVAKVHVEGGEEVAPGDPLISLDDRQIKATLNEAEARLIHMQSEYNRTNTLSSQKFASGKAYDKATAELKKAEAAVESAKVKLSQTILRAPFDGVVGLHTLSIGAYIDPNKEILTLVDLTPMKVDFKIPAEYLRSVSSGQRVEVTVDGFSEVKFQGLIEGIDSKVDVVSHSIEARALVPNKNHVLKPGLFARVDVVVGSKPSALIVPAIAVEKQGDQDAVYKVVDGLAFQTPVITGIQEGDNIEIVRGINPGDHIVTIGQNKLRDGTPVRYELDGQVHNFNEEEFKKRHPEMVPEEKKDSKSKKAETPKKEEPAKATDAKPVDAPAVTPEKKDASAVEGQVPQAEVSGSVSKAAGEVPDATGVTPPPAAEPSPEAPKMASEAKKEDAAVAPTPTPPAPATPAESTATASAAEPTAVPASEAAAPAPAPVEKKAPNPLLSQQKKPFFQNLKPAEPAPEAASAKEGVMFKQGRKE